MGEFLKHLRALAPSADCLSDLVLDAIAEGDEVRAAAARTHLAGCDHCTCLVETRRQAAATFARSCDAPTFAAAALEGARPRVTQGRWRRALLVLAATGLSATAALLVLTPESGLRTKGGTSFRVVASREGKAVDVSDRDTVKPRERLRFIVGTSKPSYLAVLGRDSEGKVWRGAPLDDSRMLRLEPGLDQALAGAVELDEQGGLERLYLFDCRNDHLVEELTSALTAAEFPRIEDCELQFLTLRKQP